MNDSTEYYDRVIQDLLEQREELDRMIAEMRRQKQFTEMRRGIFSGSTTQATEQLRTQTPSPQVSAVTDNNAQFLRGGEVTLVGGSEVILRNTGKPLHASILVDKLAEMGKATSVRSLNSTLISDTQGRFRNYGANTFGLTEWPENLAERAAGHQSDIKPVSTLSIGDGMERVFRMAGKPLPVRPDIMDGVKALGITASENSIRATLSSDRRERFERVEPGIYYLKSEIKDKVEADIDKKTEEDSEDFWEMLNQKQ